MNDAASRTAEPTTADLDARRAARRYPERPIVAVLVVVLRGDRALMPLALFATAGVWVLFTFEHTGART